MDQWHLPADIELVDVKSKSPSAEEWAELRTLAGSYEALLSKRSRTFQSLGLQATIQSDEDYGKLLPSDYTYLKRPVLVYDLNIFIGSQKSTVEAAAQFLENLKA